MANRNDYAQQRVIYLINKPAFKDAITSIRKTYKLPLNGFGSQEDVETWRQKYIYGKWVNIDDDIENRIDLEIAKIVSNPTFELSTGWHDFVKQYLFLNHATPPTSIGTKVVYDEKTKQPIIWVAVSEDTSKQDYINEWKNIEILRSVWDLKSPQRRRLADNYKLDRKAYAYKIWLNSGSYEKAAQAVEEKFANHQGHTIYTADDAKTDVQNFIKQAGI